MHNKEEYLLSIVLCGRNDNYLGDFKYRITSSINYLCKNAEKIGRLKDIEVIVVDWNSETPLSKELCLIQEAIENVKFIIVPPEIAKKYLSNGQVFNFGCAINAGIRRANGKYIMNMPADILITSTALQNLLLLLEGKLDPVFDPKKAMLNIGRKLIPWQIVEKKPELKKWDRYLQLHCRHLFYANDYPGLACGFGAILLSKYIWGQSQGFLESLYGWGWSDIELGLRINQAYPSIDLSYFGILVYDMQQSPKERSSIKYHNPHIVSFSLEACQSDWGLKKHTLDIQKPSCRHDANSSGKISYENKTIEDLIAELTSHAVFEHAQKNIASWNIWNIDLSEWESLSALSWYGLHYLPRTYLDFGIKKAHAAALVAAACPSVEIYGVDSWQPENGDSSSSPASATGFLHSIGYQGYLRFVTGDPHAAFQRLRDSFIGHLSLDLALVRGDMFGPDATQQLSDLIPHLTPGGMIVFTCSFNDSFQHVWSEMQTKFTQFTYLQCKSEKTGLILTASLQDSNLNTLSNARSELRVDFGNSPRPGLLVQLRRAFRALRNPTKYPEYAKRIYCFLFDRE